MFTGLIEEKGTITMIQKSSKSAKITITARKIVSDLKLGDSVCTNGACLTVVEIANNDFTVDVMLETINSTTLKKLIPGNEVNLERALKLNDRLGGHIVSGHVDGTAKITNIKMEGIATIYTLQPDSSQMQFIIKKGSITIDGISLTISDIHKDQFMVSIIPHTAENTTLPDRKVGDLVNIETDTIAKYVHNMINHNRNKNNDTSISIEALMNKGF